MTHGHAAVTNNSVKITGQAFSVYSQSPGYIGHTVSEKTRLCGQSVFAVNEKHCGTSCSYGNDARIDTFLCLSCDSELYV
jgi:ribosomal protein L37E